MTLESLLAELRASKLTQSLVSRPFLIALMDVAMAAKRVMDDLEVHGAEIVPHLIDSDDNDGQRLRDALSRLSIISEETR